MFGEKTPVDAYLNKFFDFSIKLDIVVMHDAEFQKKYEELVEYFNIDYGNEITELHKFMNIVFKGYTAREKNKIILCSPSLITLLFSFCTTGNIITFDSFSSPYIPVILLVTGVC